VVWEEAFNRQHNAIQVGYVTTSSSEGIRQITQLLGDFAIGEIPLTGEQMKSPPAQLTQIPIAVAAVVPIYNVPGSGHLRFSGELLAEIYLGNVTNWNDRRIALLNPGVLLPSLPIVAVQRHAGSGTRYILTEFLIQSSPGFRAWVEVSPPREWGKIMASNSKDMVEKVMLTPGAIGYVERSFALRYGVPYGSVQNRAGKFVEASEASVEEACKAKQKFKSDFQVSLINAEGENSYPLASFAWAYVPASGLAPGRRDALREFLNWSLQDGQILMVGHDYFPLPRAVADRARARVQAVLQ
jgi:phosphate transport system substrate-binding protein